MRLLALLPFLLGLSLTAQAAEPSAAPTEAPPPAAFDTPEAEAQPTELPLSNIYLLARIKLNGTDLSQTALLQERTITTLEDCEKERTAGLTTGWQSYHHYLKTYKGVSYKVDYRCVVANQKISAWRSGAPLDSFYMVRSGENRLRLEKYRNFFDCRDALQAKGLKESVDNFCARASQRLVGQQ